MLIEQLSVFLQNEAGRLAQMCALLGDEGFDMHALVVADTSEYGVARVICDRPHSARRVLEAAGLAVSVTRVVAVEVLDGGQLTGVARRRLLGLGHGSPSGRCPPAGRDGGVVAPTGSDPGVVPVRMAHRHGDASG